MPDTRPAEKSAPRVRPLHRWAVACRDDDGHRRLVSSHLLRTGALHAIIGAPARTRERLQIEPTDWAPTRRLRAHLIAVLGAVLNATTEELTWLTVLTRPRIEAVLRELVDDGLVVFRAGEPGDRRRGWRLCTHEEVRRRLHDEVSRQLPGRPPY